MTQFSEVYNRFLEKITDDMYLELTPEDTMRDLQNLLIDAIPGFEYPRKCLDEYSIGQEYLTETEAQNTGRFVLATSDEDLVIVDNSAFEADLTSEEINILALLMKQGWIQRQVTSIENTRMKYAGSDFKMTSQANHLAKLLTLLAEAQRESFHMQRLYKRREKNGDNVYQSTWYKFGPNAQ